MRVAPNLSALLNAGIQSTAQALNTAVQQLSSGERVVLPSDDPAAASANAESVASSALADSYTNNGEAVVSQAQMADSALSNVVSELNQAITLGTEGADGSMSTSDRETLATQVQSILSEVVSQANTTFNGVSLFSGTANVTEAYVPDNSSPTGYSYQGNDGVNQAAIGDNLQVNINVPGDQIFTKTNGNVLGSLAQLASALSSGSTTNIGDAVAAVKDAITNVSQQRVSYSSVVKQVQAQDEYLSQETISLTSQQQALTGVDLTTAISNMTQAQTAHTAMLAAAAKVLPTSLLDYLK